MRHGLSEAVSKILGYLADLSKDSAVIAVFLHVGNGADKLVWSSVSLRYDVHVKNGKDKFLIDLFRNSLAYSFVLQAGKEDHNDKRAE